jgi:8-oxo-dGTP diphosphatase
MAAADGNGWVHCRCGSRHWGLYGAAGLLLLDSTLSLVLVQLRAAWVHQGGTWSTPGGAIDSHETPLQAALREAEEECGVQPPDVSVLASYPSLDHGDWAYHLVIGRLDGASRAHAANDESARVEWVALDDVARLPLHTGFAAGWPATLLRIAELGAGR